MTLPVPRTLLLAVLLAALPTLARAQDAPTRAEVDSRITDITVYRQGALVRRKASLTLATGNQDVAFVALERGIRPGSVQLAVDAGVSTFALDIGLDPSRPAADPDSLRVLRGRLDSLELALARVAAQRAGVTEQLAVLAANRDLTGEQSATPTNATAVAEAARLYREHTTQAHVADYELQVREKALQELRQQYSRRIGAIRPPSRTDIGRITATLLAERAGTYEVELSYIVDGASWTPDYDLFADGERGTEARLLLSANVVQNTGVDWRDVRLTLSSSDINSRLDAPAWSPTYLGHDRERLAQARVTRNDAYDMDVSAEASMSTPAAAKASYAPATFATESSSAAARLYAVERPFSLATNGRPSTVRLVSYQLPLALRYRVVPKREPVAYLEGVVTGWDTLNLLGAQLRLHLDGRFLGTTFLDPTQASDTLTVGLGPDPRLVVERTGRDQSTDHKFIRGRRVYELGYRITLRNTRAVAVDVVVEDQLPVSTRDEITVELKSATGRPERDEATGKLTWRLSLKPATREQLDVRYVVEAPKDVDVRFE